MNEKYHTNFKCIFSRFTNFRTDRHIKFWRTWPNIPLYQISHSLCLVISRYRWFHVIQSRKVCTQRHAICNCNSNWGTCIAPSTRRPRAHHRVNPYPGARRQNETDMFSDHDRMSRSIAAVSAPSVACSMLTVQRQKRLCRQHAIRQCTLCITSKSWSTWFA